MSRRLGKRFYNRTTGAKGPVRGEPGHGPAPTVWIEQQLRGARRPSRHLARPVAATGSVRETPGMLRGAKRAGPESSPRKTVRGQAGARPLVAISHDVRKTESRHVPETNQMASAMTPRF